MDFLKGANLISMLSKALNVLGFPTYQTFEQTAYDTICTAFLTKLMMVMKERKQKVMEAKEMKNKGRRRHQIQKEEESWRMEVCKINEAFQVNGLFTSTLSTLPRHNI